MIYPHRHPCRETARRVTFTTWTAVIAMAAGAEHAALARPAFNQDPVPRADASDARRAAVSPSAADQDGATALPASSVERLQGLAAGRFQNEPARDDVSLVLRALHQRDPAVGRQACLAVEKLAPTGLFEPADMQRLWDGLRPKLRSADADTSAWSARALAALARDTDLVAGRILAEALDETLHLLTSGDHDARHRGAAVANGALAAANGALAARKAALAAGTPPGARPEEDVAFFEKRYRTKITGVKPKAEYPDPDQFYSAIGAQLGIRETAWLAAARAFGWTKDDGKQTFTILKGGPTAGGGEGSWDVMFIRSAIDPGTKKPIPGTVQQVMVHVDYDVNVTFPEPPAGNR